MTWLERITMGARKPRPLRELTAEEIRDQQRYSPDQLLRRDVDRIDAELGQVWVVTALLFTVTALFGLLLVMTR